MMDEHEERDQISRESERLWMEEVHERANLESPAACAKAALFLLQKKMPPEMAARVIKEYRVGQHLAAGRARCGHENWKDGYCAEMWCSNYIRKHMH